MGLSLKTFTKKSYSYITYRDRDKYIVYTWLILLFSHISGVLGGCPRNRYKYRRFSGLSLIPALLGRK